MTPGDAFFLACACGWFGTGRWCKAVANSHFNAQIVPVAASLGYALAHPANAPESVASWDFALYKQKVLRWPCLLSGASKESSPKITYSKAWWKRLQTILLDIQLQRIWMALSHGSYTSLKRFWTSGKLEKLFFVIVAIAHSPWALKLWSVNQCL